MWVRKQTDGNIMNEEIKEWINNSRTYRGILAHRQTCDKQRRGKFCITCTGRDVYNVVRSLEHEIGKEIRDNGNDEQKTTIFLTLMRLEASMYLPKDMRDLEDKDILNFIKDRIQKDQSEEIELTW